MNPQVLLLLIEYGPQIAGLLEKMIPAIEAATAAGASHSQAVSTVVGSAAEHVDSTDWAAAVRGFPAG